MAKKTADTRYLTKMAREYSLDFLDSDDLSEIEEGIRQTQQGIVHANLAVAIALARIERSALYTQAGYTYFRDYLKDSDNRLQMPRQTMHDYLRIGQVFLDHQHGLITAGFDRNGPMHNLRYLPAAIEHHDPQQAYRNCARMSFREFKRFAREEEEPSVPEEWRKRREKPVGGQQAPEPSVEITPKQIRVDGKNILRLDPDLAERTRDDLSQYLRQIYRIRAAGNTPVVLEVYDDGEARAVENYLKRLRAKR